MKILKNFLIGAGVVFLLILSLAAFMVGSSSKFLDKYEPFVKQFTRDFSQKWEVADISNRCTTGFLSQINTPNGMEAISTFKTLGKLVDTSDFEMDHYATNTNAPTIGVIKFKAKFENADVIVTVTLHEEEDVAKVHGFYVDPITGIQKTKDVKA